MKKILLVLGLAVILASSSQALIFGAEVGGMPYIGFRLNKNQVIDVGLSYNSQNDGDATNLTFLGRFENKIADVKKLKLSWAGQLTFGSAKTTFAGASTTTTTITLAGLVGAEYKITDALGFYGYLNLLNYQTVSNGGSAASYWLLTGPALAYTGFKIYL